MVISFERDDDAAAAGRSRRRAWTIAVIGACKHRRKTLPAAAGDRPTIGVMLVVGAVEHEVNVAGCGERRSSNRPTRRADRRQRRPTADAGEGGEMELVIARTPKSGESAGAGRGQPGAARCGKRERGLLPAAATTLRKRHFGRA